MTKECVLRDPLSDFVIWVSFVIRHSSFVIGLAPFDIFA